MSKVKTIMSTGILIAGSALSNASFEHKEKIDFTSQHTQQVTHKSKRTPQKVYHRFEDIPEISDTEAHLYSRDEYTYIINAERYQQTGKIELKRVLSAEVTQANALSLIYRSECGDYIPQANEDQIVHYNVDMKILNTSGKYKGPSQMDDVAVTSYIRFLAATPETRQYVLPLLKYSPSGNMPQTLTNALEALEKLYYNEQGKLRPMNERNSIVSNKLFTSIKLNDNAWKNIASSKLKAYIQKESHKRKNGLSNTTKNYLCLTELLPSAQLMQRTMEDYNLTTYCLGRSGKPKDIMMALALSMDLKDTNGNLDATRIPTYAIAASISHLNWKGNGQYALSQARQLRSEFKTSWQKGNKALKEKTKLWVTGKSREKGVNELSQLNIITPTLIRQYQELELAGADNLAHKYQKQVEAKETQITTKDFIQLATLTQKQR
ncbi:MAG: hypothetical protein NC218_05410 [Acetobacter sp.]|nr:hypothetical protein [Acetobacter sp.]